MKYKISWYENGIEKNVVSSFFNQLLKIKRCLESHKVFVLFVRTDIRREDLKPVAA